MELKTRSPLYLKQLSDEVLKNVDRVARESGLAKWLLIEIILEDHFDIKNSNKIDLKKYVGINRTNARTGKPSTKKLTK